jgi:hypothetical protein
VLVVFPAADLSLSEFARDLAQGFKGSATLANAQKHIHLIVNCSSIEEFDKQVKDLPMGGVQMWADVGGGYAKRLGLKPSLEEVDLKSLFDEGPSTSRSGSATRRTAEQVQLAMIVVMNGKIAKSPAYQPKFQGCSLSNLKSVLEYMQNTAQFQYEKVVSKDSFGPELSIEELQKTYKEAWKAFQDETGTITAEERPSQPGSAMRKQGQARAQPAKPRLPPTRKSFPSPGSVKQTASRSVTAKSPPLVNGTQIPVRLRSKL